ncbi:uncharacterized protein LOC127968082 [Carassius gibelio]|uniref:uncharacterized protein LOC127968082 n=1 Tax=Carassius gibelio TaxID=101364 RepID=UPI00227811AE|nr:uncharacterized protein LOC127968082 [Carassius gibelio]
MDVFHCLCSSSRIKSFLLPAIPKPCIPGLEPALLKKGNIDEINQHFSSFHCYKSPQYCTETWYQVNVDTSPAVTPSVQSDGIQEDVLIKTITPIVPIGPITQYVTCPDGQQSVQTNSTPAPYCHGSTPYCEEDTPPADPGPAHPALMSVPGMDYSMILSPVPYCEEDTPPPDLGPAHPVLKSVPGMDYSMIVSPTPYCEEDMPPADPGPAHPALMSVPGMDYSMIVSPTPYCEEDMPPDDPGPAHPVLMSVPGMDYSMILSPVPYREEDTPPPDLGPAQPELTSVPGMDYSMILSPAPVAPPTQDFYMCVNGVTPAGTLHLVPYLQLNEGADYKADKNSQLAALLEKQMEALLSRIESNPSEAVMPSQPHSPDRICRSI